MGVTAVFQIIVYILLALILLGTLAFLGRAWRARSETARAPYGVGHLESRQTARRNLLWGFLLLVGGFLCVGSFLLVSQIAALLPHIPDWFCVNVMPAMAEKLAPLLSQKMASKLRQLEDVYHILQQSPPAELLAQPQVRLLMPDDLPLLQAAPPELRGYDPEKLVYKTAAAGAIIDNQLVAIAQNYALTEGYGDIGVFTLPEWRGRGFAAAATAQVARWLQGNGRIPVWSCGAHNQASLRVAEKVGFVENGRRVYLILEK